MPKISFSDMPPLVRLRVLAVLCEDGNLSLEALGRAVERLVGEHLIDEVQRDCGGEG